MGVAIDRLTSISTGDLNIAIGGFQRLSASEFNEALTSVNPEQYNSSAKSYMESSQQSFAALQDRLNALRDSLAFTPFGFNNTFGQVGFNGKSDFPVKQLGFWHHGSKLYTYEELPGVTNVTLDLGRFAEGLI